MKITVAEFYSRVSEILENYTKTDMLLSDAGCALDELNEYAEESGLKVSVSLEVLGTLKKENSEDFPDPSYEPEEEEPEEDYSYEDSYEDSYEPEPEEDDDSYESSYED